MEQTIRNLARERLGFDDLRHPLRVAEDSTAEDRFGWETEGLRRLSRVMARERGE